MMRHSDIYLSFCRWKVKNEGNWKDAEALSVVSFHGNSGVWKGLLAFTVPVVYNIHNWLGLMRRRSAITTSHRHIHHHPHVTIMLFEIMLNLSAWRDTDSFFSVLKLKWLIDGRVHLSGSCLLFWLSLSLTLNPDHRRAEVPHESRFNYHCCCCYSAKKFQSMI